MGRPCKYQSEAERRVARRAQTREHVRKHRALKRSCSEGSPYDGKQELLEQCEDSEESRTLCPTFCFSPLDICQPHNNFSDLPPSEIRFFHYFRHYVTREISGYFPSDFWQRDIPLAVYGSSAVRHTVVAFSSLHEAFKSAHTALKPSKPSLHSESRPGMPPVKQSHSVITSANKERSRIGRAERHSTWTAFGFGHYNKAIRCLLGGSESSLDAILICCLLFVCIDRLLGNYDVSQMHLKHGINILSQTGNGKAQTVLTLKVPPTSNRAAAPSACNNYSSLEYKTQDKATLMKTRYTTNAKLKAVLTRMLVCATRQVVRQRDILGYKALPFDTIAGVSIHSAAGELPTNEFTTVAGAKDAFDALLIAILTTRGPIDNTCRPLLSEATASAPASSWSRLHTLLSSWRRRFEHVVKRTTTSGNYNSTRGAICLLRCYYCLAKVTVGMGWERDADMSIYTRDFRALLVSARELLDIETAAGLVDSPRFEADYTMSSPSPLMYTAILCADAGLRAEAVRIMQRMPRTCI